MLSFNIIKNKIVNKIYRLRSLYLYGRVSMIIPGIIPFFFSQL